MMMTMTMRILMKAILAICLLQLTQSAPAFTGKGTIRERDTDKDDSLRSKLQRLHELITELEPPDSESDLKNVADVESAPEAPKAAAEEANIHEERAVSSKDMGKYARMEDGATDNENSDTANHNMDTIQLLSKALARLREPRYEAEESHGEHLRDENNASEEDGEGNGERLRRLEATIQRALKRLNEDKSTPTAEMEDQEDYEDTRNAEMAEDKFHREAVSVIEERLIRDIVLGAKMGVSVDQLIDDLEERAFKAAAMKKIEEGLASQMMDSFGTVRGRD